MGTYKFLVTVVSKHIPQQSDVWNIIDIYIFNYLAYEYGQISVIYT